MQLKTLPTVFTAQVNIASINTSLPKVNYIHFRLVGECMGLAKALG